MPIVSFWNNEKVETGKTLSMVAIATYMAIMHNYKILVISTEFDDDTINDCFWEKEREQMLSEISSNKMDISTGIEGLAKAVMSNKSSPEIITNYTKIVFKDRLEVLLGMRTKEKEEYERISPAYIDIIQFANKYYDLVFVDVTNGFDEAGHSEQILKISDLIIYNLAQRLRTINEIQELKQKSDIFKQNNYLLSIGRYDRFSKYSTKNLARLLGERKELLAVPYCTLFADAAGEGKVADYFIRFNKIMDETDRNAIFISEVKKTVDRIIYKLQELQMKI